MLYIICHFFAALLLPIVLGRSFENALAVENMDRLMGLEKLGNFRKCRHFEKNKK